jgi:hypothetical protein
MRSYIYRQKITLELKHTLFRNADFVECDLMCGFACTKEELDKILPNIVDNCTFIECRLEYGAPPI